MSFESIAALIAAVVLFVVVIAFGGRWRRATYKGVVFVNIALALLVVGSYLVPVAVMCLPVSAYYVGLGLHERWQERAQRRSSVAQRGRIV